MAGSVPVCVPPIQPPPNSKGSALLSTNAPQPDHAKRDASTAPQRLNSRTQPQSTHSQHTVPPWRSLCGTQSEPASERHRTPTRPHQRGRLHCTEEAPQQNTAPTPQHLTTARHRTRNRSGRRTCPYRWSGLLAPRAACACTARLPGTEQPSSVRTSSRASLRRVSCAERRQSGSESNLPFWTARCPRVVKGCPTSRCTPSSTPQNAPSRRKRLKP